MKYSPHTAHNAFFWGTLGFLCGTALAAYSLPLYIVGGIGIASCLYAQHTGRSAWMTALFFAMSTLGLLYYSADDYRYQQQLRTLKEETVFSGTITRVPRERAGGQSLFVSLDNGRGNILVYTTTPRKHAYGEHVLVHGLLNPPTKDSYGTHLAQEHVSGTIFTDEITVRAQGGVPILVFLFSIRNYIETTLSHHFAPEANALMQAILIGNRDLLSQSTITTLSLSGTLHITALSGGHITIITFALQAFLQAILPARRRTSFLLTFTVVGLFVAMTGFVISAVRAALMACAVQVGELFERKKAPRNVITLTALILVLHDPKTLTADVGFQLSCLATIGIIYGTPILGRLSWFAKPGIAGWRYILAATIAAQIAVFPITTTLFQNFSFISLPANVAVVFTMPLLTVGGFVLVIAATISQTLSSALAVPLSFLLWYTQNAVEWFAALAVPFNPRFSVSANLIYYGTLVWFVSKEKPFEKITSPRPQP